MPRSTPVFDPAEAELRAAKALALAADPDPKHALHVCALSLDLFDETASLHGLGEAERRLLGVAALLHDTGWETRPECHHKGSRDFVLGANIEGLSEHERQVAACVARYHRKAHPKPTHKIYRDLSPQRQRTVTLLAGMLRIADGLDRSHRAATERITARHTSGALHLIVTQRDANTTDIWGANRKSGLFAEALGLSVEIVLKAL
ncbi:MAG: HD domain-containing protein [bacterium]|nr:HD domain-containing protein [bacterium]